MKQRELKAIERQEFTVEKGDPVGDGLARAFISTQSVDRMGDVVVATGCKAENFLRNPVVLYTHNSGHMPGYGELPIGRATELTIVPGVGVKATWEWAPHAEAQTIRDLWNLGFLNAVSIGFRPLAYTELDGDSWYPPVQFDEWELMEFSVCPVPANQNALRLALGGMEQADLLRVKAVLQKAGRVLSAANEASLKDARDLIDGVLAAVVPAEDAAPADDAKTAPLGITKDATVSSDAPDTELDVEPLIADATAAITANVASIIRLTLIAALALDEVEDLAEPAA